MFHARSFATAVAAVSLASLALASGAGATNPCKASKGVSRCTFGVEEPASGQVEPLGVGQAVQAEWWGRGSYFSAGRYSFLCHAVSFGASVSGFKAGGPLFALSSASFSGTGTGGACTSSLGTATVNADASGWQMRLSVTETPSGSAQYSIKDLASSTTGAPLRISAEFFEAGVGTIDCTWQAKSVKGSSPWAAGEPVGGWTAAGPFKLDNEATNSPLCPATGKLETAWRFFEVSPLGTLKPIVLAIG